MKRPQGSKGLAQSNPLNDAIPQTNRPCECRSMEGTCRFPPAASVSNESVRNKAPDEVFYKSTFALAHFRLQNLLCKLHFFGECTAQSVVGRNGCCSEEHQAAWRSRSEFHVRITSISCALLRIEANSADPQQLS